MTNQIPGSPIDTMRSSVHKTRAEGIERSGMPGARAPGEAGKERKWRTGFGKTTTARVGDTSSTARATGLRGGQGRTASDIVYSAFVVMVWFGAILLLAVLSISVQIDATLPSTEAPVLP